MLELQPELINPELAAIPVGPAPENPDPEPAPSPEPNSVPDTQPSEPRPDFVPELDPIPSPS